MKNDKPNINKDFKVSQQAEEMQKIQAEVERTARISQVREDTERQSLERMVRVRDNELKTAIQDKEAEQQKAIRDEVQKRLDAQKFPSLDHPVHKTTLGKSPQDVAAKAAADFKELHATELAAFADGQKQVFDKIIDKKIDAAWSKQVEQDRQKHSEQTFDKSADKSPTSSKDAFQKAHDRTGGEKDWRSLREDREKDQDNKREP